MIFGTPVWLWLSLAVLIPVMIHLWNRKSGRPQLLGTFRFLPEQSFSAARRIELHEIPLMILRIVMVVLIALLLSELFWKAEPLQRDLVYIIETTNIDNRIITEENGNLQIDIPSDEINKLGWWNITAQADYDYNPRQITIWGRLSTDRFGLERPLMKAGLSFKTVDSLQMSDKILASWMGENGEMFSLQQQRTEAGIRTNVIPGEESEEEPVQLRMIVNSTSSDNIKSALEYTANLWNIQVEEQSITELARIQKSNGSFVGLTQTVNESGFNDVVNANAWSGIGFEVTNIDTSIKAPDTILQTGLSGSPFLYRDEDGQLMVNGSPDELIDEWVFAGLGNQLVLEALDVGKQLSPVMKESQRWVRNNESDAVQVAEKLHSLHIWLFGLLIGAWLLERTLAPKRGM